MNKLASFQLANQNFDHVLTACTFREVGLIYDYDHFGRSKSTDLSETNLISSHYLWYILQRTESYRNISKQFTTSRCEERVSPILIFFLPNVRLSDYTTSHVDEDKNMLFVKKDMPWIIKYCCDTMIIFCPF